MAITAEQAAQLASTYQSGDTSGLQGLVSSMGVTAGDVAQYFPGFDVGSLQGVTLAPSAPAAPPAPTYGTSKFTGDVISDFISANLEKPELIAQKAKEFGLSASDIQKAAGYSPEQQAKFFSYAGVTPTGISGLTPMSYGDKGQFTAKDVIDYVNANLVDPTRISQASQRYAVTPEQLQSLYTGSATPYNLQQIKSYLETGQKGLPTRIQDIIASTIGGVNTAPTVESLFQNILGRTPTQSELDFWQQKFGPEIDQNEIDIAVQAAQAEKAGAKYDKPPTTADLIGLIEGSLSPSTTKLSSFTPESLSKKSIEEIEELIAQSPTNRLQEAGRVSGLAQRLYGISKEDATKLASNLFAGKDTDDFAEGIYKDLLTKGFTKDVQNEVFLNAAKTNPNSQFFKDNPDLLLAYSPLTEKTGQTGVYGYLNNAPILNANFADQKLGDKNQVVPHLGSDPNKFGWTTNSKYTETIMRGPAIFGIEFNNRNDVEKAIALETGVRNGDIFYDNESNQYYDRQGKVVEAPSSDNERKGYSPQAVSTLTKLQEAAQKAGLNPAAYRSAGDLFDALENKTKNIYQVVGRAIDWDPTAAKNLGITQTTGGRGGVNQANVLYEKIGDKLVPVNAKAFEYHDPNTSRGAIGDFFQGIASIPFVAEIASVATGGNPFVYAALKGAQTLALGGDLDDAFKTAGIAYLTSEIIPKSITPNIQTALAQNSLISSLAQSSPEIANLVINSGTRAIVSSGLAAITGQDPEKAALNALVQSGLGSLTKEGLKLTNIPQEYHSIVSNILSSAVLNQDPTKSLAGAATNILKNELKDFGKETVKSDQDKTTKEVKI
jgi:hypothetical protein